ncbi:MAG: TPM domain-containing protein [Candidatus Izemoplasmatales bacterium]|nr:TPM domain-containing protein [Candidatus Izemoplasmatales bacterium]
MSRFKLIGLFLFLLVAIGYWIFAGSKKYPLPTESYYINDYADALLMSTRSTIARESERLYNFSQDYELPGTQIVFTTFLVDNVNEISEYDKTEIYREWGIGNNDMGFLLIMFFTQEGDNLSLVGTKWEPGYRMEQFLPPSRVNSILENSIYSDEYIDSLDMAVANCLYRILEVVYVNVYGQLNFNFDMDMYYDYMINYDRDEFYDTKPMSMFSYLFSENAFIFDQVFFFLPAALFVTVGGFGIFKAGGGRSGGLGGFKRR